MAKPTPTPEAAPPTSLGPEEGPNPASAIYGTVLAMAVIATLGIQPAMEPVRIAAWVAATAIVFWLSHAYSHVVAYGVRRRGSIRLLARRALRREWPMVQGALIPAAALLLTPLHIASAETAETIALMTGVGVLFGTGLMIGYSEGDSVWRALLLSFSNVFFGLLIVGLKILVH